MEMPIWDTLSGGVESRIRMANAATQQIGMSIDLRLAVIQQKNAVQTFQTGTGKLMWEFEPGTNPVSLASFDVRTERVAMVCESEVQILNAATGRPLVEPLRHPTQVSAAEFSPDGRYLVTGCAHHYLTPRDAYVWDVRTGKAVGRPMRHADRIWNVAISPDSRRVATCSADRTARVWNVDTSQPATPPLRHGDAVHAVAFSPDSRWVATASADETARVWDATTGEPLTPPLRHGEEVIAVQFLADGRYLLTQTRSLVRTLWDLRTDLFSGDEWVLVAGLLAARRIDDPGVLQPVEAEAVNRMWRSLKDKYQRHFAAP
jgi:WD40 repeat protein